MDEQLDVCLKAYFDNKFTLEDSLVKETKLRIKQKASQKEAQKESLVICLIQAGFLASTLSLSVLVFITVGFNTFFLMSAVGYLAAVSLIGTLLVLFGTKNIQEEIVYE